MARFLFTSARISCLDSTSVVNVPCYFGTLPFSYKNWVSLLSGVVLVQLASFPQSCLNCRLYLCAYVLPKLYQSFEQQPLHKMDYRGLVAVHKCVCLLVTYSQTVLQTKGKLIMNKPRLDHPQGSSLSECSLRLCYALGPTEHLCSADQNYND